MRVSFFGNIYIIQLCSGITRCRVLNGELHAQLTEVNLSAFVYRLFQQEFSPIMVTKFSGNLVIRHENG